MEMIQRNSQRCMQCQQEGEPTKTAEQSALVTMTQKSLRERPYENVNISSNLGERRTCMDAASSGNRCAVPKKDHTYEEPNEVRNIARLLLKSSRPRKAKTEATFLLVLFCLSLLSLMASGYVGYLVLHEGLDEAPGFDHEKLLSSLEAKMDRMKTKLQNFKRNSTNYTAVKILSEDQRSLEELIAKVKSHSLLNARKLALLTNITVENMNNRTGETTSRITEILTNPKPKAPRCRWKKYESLNNKGSTLERVLIPIEDKGFVTLGITCSTTTRNPPKRIYMVPPNPRAGFESFFCYCQNDGNQSYKTIDCVAHSWQCKLPN